MLVAGAIRRASAAGAAGRRATHVRRRAPSSSHPVVQYIDPPSAGAAVVTLQRESDPGRGWALFEVSVAHGGWLDIRFFQTMMGFCHRCLPRMAPKVLDIAVARGIRVCDKLFGTFLEACRRSDPPLVREALDAFSKHGPRSPDIIAKLVHICRESSCPDQSLFLLSDAIQHRVKVSEKLVILFATCCAEAQGRQAAETAELLLNLMRTKIVVPLRCPKKFQRLIHLLVSQGRASSATDALSYMESLGLPTQNAFSLVLRELALRSHVQQAMSVFQTMVDKSMTVGVAELTLLVTACGRCADLPAIGRIQEYARDKKHPNLACALIEAYGSSGQLSAAEELFQGLDAPDVRAFNVIIQAYGRNGMAQSAASMFDRMKNAGVQPDQDTLVGLLTACASAGDVAGAGQFLSEFSDTWHVSLTSAHVKRIIDLHGKLGNLESAERLARSSAASDSIELWMSVLDACCKHNDIARAERVFSVIVSLGNDNPPVLTSAYALMAAIYDCNSRSEHAAGLRTALKERGVDV